MNFEVLIWYNSILKIITTVIIKVITCKKKRFYLRNYGRNPQLGVTVAILLINMILSDILGLIYRQGEGDVQLSGRRAKERIT